MNGSLAMSPPGKRLSDKQLVRPTHQFKPAVAQSKNATDASSVRRTITPPAYRPQLKPTTVPAKSAGLSQVRRQTVAHPVYRPQPAPKVLQTKSAHHQSAIQKKPEA